MNLEQLASRWQVALALNTKLRIKSKSPLPSKICYRTNKNKEIQIETKAGEKNVMPEHKTL